MDQEAYEIRKVATGYFLVASLAAASGFESLSNSFLRDGVRLLQEVAAIRRLEQDLLGQETAPRRSKAIP
jgi:hypothetical protein